MRRIRLVFLALAVVLAVPLALLVDRTLDSVAAERVLRHRTVADRVIDEMERELNELVRREEERPYGHYRSLFVPEDGSELRRSPLAKPPSDSFVVGYFQIDPDGTVSSPMWSEDPAAADDDGGAAEGEVRERREFLTETVRAAFETPPQRPEADTVAELEEERRAKEREEKLVKDASASDRGSALDVIQKLNRAATARQQRSPKVEATQAESAYEFSRPPQLVVGDARDEETFDVRLEPLMGRPAREEDLFLYRTVVIGDRAYRQGLLLSRPALVEWLAGRVLESTGLAGSITIAPGATDDVPGFFTYRHRFAEPFGSLVATLVLRPLPERRGTGYVLALVILLVLTAVLGFFALYRMTAVAVRFAERRNDFVSAVTHELKTPLTAIRMYGEMLRDGVVPEDKKGRYYGTITAESERLSRLVDNVLELSRLERRTRQMRLEDGDVEPILREVGATLEPHVEKAEVDLRLDATPGTGTARFDRDALLQVLFNLVDNAVKYSASAARRQVVLACRPSPGGGVSILVQDRGPGVSPRHLRKIFEPFYRGQRELTRTTAGTGIGLALVRGLVEEMGGSVVGRNREGGGFEVEIILPPGQPSLV